MKNLISIIIPIYNTEAYLYKCLDSIKNQTYTNFEVLLIDDGSSDNSGAICDSYSKIDKRFLSFHIKNGGVSKARNYGIERAHGEWLFFIDSDDFIEFDYLESYLNSVDDVVDIIVGGYTSFGNARIGLQGYSFNNKLFSGAFLYESLRNVLVYCTPWGKLFKKAIIEQNHLVFEERLSMSEDRLFLYEYLSHINSILFIQYNGYHYRVTDSSLMNSKHHREEVILKKTLLWNAAFKIKDKWNMSLGQFAPLYNIHARDIINTLGIKMCLKEKRDLYLKTIGVFFKNEYYQYCREERKTIKTLIDSDLFFSSFGFYKAICVRLFVSTISKIRQIFGA